MKHTLKTLLAAFALMAVIISSPVFSTEHAADATALPTVSVDAGGNATTADGKPAADGQYTTTDAEGKASTVTVKDGKVVPAAE